MNAQKSAKTHAAKGASERSREAFLEEDLEFQRRQWRVERVGWAVMVVIIVAALAGVFGAGGLVARATASAGSTEVQYARFARYAAPTAIEVKVAAAANGRPIRLRVSDRYLSAMNVRAITPPPASTAIADREHVFVFERSVSPAAATIRFDLEPAAMGRHDGWIAIDEAAPVFFTHFIYP